MKRTHCHSLILLVLLLASLPALASIRSDQERLLTLTDRAIYAAGESIFFSCKYTGTADASGGSKVVYFDLITPEGQMVASSKVAILDGYARGALEIPANSMNGLYYLHAYTRWQRNFDVRSMNYTSVKVINPLSTDHLPVDSELSMATLSPACDPTLALQGVHVLTETRQFAPESQVELELSIARAHQLCASVIPAGTGSEQWVLTPVVDEVREVYVGFIPETRGISISGRVEAGKLEEGNGQGASQVGGSYHRVFLTVLDSLRSFYPVMTDGEGRFNIALPGHSGSRDLFISADGGEDLELLIDTDFSSERASLPSMRLDLDSAAYETALRIARNQQLGQYFADQPLPEQEAEITHLFYGTPSKVVEIADFIDLPSLSEYFLELFPQVSVSRNGGKATIRINGLQAEMKIYDPLILIDGVAISDKDAFLSVKPSSLERIELVDQPWIRGDFIFGGIISITSRNHDFAGVELPQSGLFLPYRFYGEEKPLPQELVPQSRNIPDARNTLYWNPGLNLVPGESATVSFRSPDRPGAYTLVLRQIDEAGLVRSLEWEFEVR